jgi:osmoprotectant transport system permease protein
VEIASFLEFLQSDATQRTLLAETREHLIMIALPILGALVVGIALGIAAHRFRFLRGSILNMVSWFLTIPSLAFFALLIPIVGIGNTAPMTALFFYALLPIVRNTVAGLTSVDQAVVESAKGMGMGRVKRLLQIELPNAWPVILAGARVATLLLIGIAAIAAVVGGDGLGQSIYRGINRIPAGGSLEAILSGTLMIVVLAVLIDLIYLGIGRLTIPRGLRD